MQQPCAARVHTSPAWSGIRRAASRPPAALSPAAAPACVAGRRFVAPGSRMCPMRALDVLGSTEVCALWHRLGHGCCLYLQRQS
eukprot:364995-Chlamydomonas_euryale.AAC.13